MNMHQANWEQTVFSDRKLFRTFLPFRPSHRLLSEQGKRGTGPTITLHLRSGALGLESKVPPETGDVHGSISRKTKAIRRYAPAPLIFRAEWSFPSREHRRTDFRVSSIRVTANRRPQQAALRK